MRFDLISLFPAVVAQFAQLGVTGEACRRGLLELFAQDPRDHCGPSRRPDDKPYGGGAGMVLKAEPMHAAIQAARCGTRPDRLVIALTPQGERFNQIWAEAIVARGGAILVCGRYEGMDERLLEAAVDVELSLGDFILSGAELPALSIVDACARLIPGVLGAEDALESESFVDDLLEFPHYTRLPEWQSQVVPPVLLSGNHQKIARWRRQQALGRTFFRRPDLLDNLSLSAEDLALLREFLTTESE